MNNYYLERQEKLLEDHNQLLNKYQEILLERYDQKLVFQIIAECEVIFLELLADTPYIGGDANQYTQNLLAGVSNLAFYKTMKNCGKEVEEIGRIMYRGSQAYFNEVPKPIRIEKGKAIFLPEGIENIKQRALISQEKNYLWDWVFEVFDEKAGKEYKISFTECGIQKYLKVNKAEELTPYMCYLDYPVLKSFGIELQKKQDPG